MPHFEISTKSKRQIIDLTNQVNQIAKNMESGNITLFVQHTTCALSAADLDPGGTDQDYLDVLDKLLPNVSYRHPHDPAHMPDHILATLIGPDLIIPVSVGRLDLGTWQRIVLFEFDGPRQRRISYRTVND